MSNLKHNGVSRDKDNERSILVSFNRRLTDDELRFFDEVCGRTAPLMDGIDRPETSASRLAREMREGTARFVSAKEH